MKKSLLTILSVRELVYKCISSGKLSRPLASGKWRDCKSCDSKRFKCSNFLTIFIEKNKSGTKRTNRRKKRTNLESKGGAEWKSGYLYFHGFVESSYPLMWAVFFNSCTRSKVIGEIGSFSNLHGKKLHVSQDYSVLTCVKTAYLTLIWSFAALRDLEKLM